MKTVMLWGAAHNALLKLKDNETSFSEVILKLANKYNKKNDFKKFACSLKENRKILIYSKKSMRMKEYEMPKSCD